MRYLTFILPVFLTAILLVSCNEKQEKAEPESSDTTPVTETTTTPQQQAPAQNTIDLSNSGTSTKAVPQSNMTQTTPPGINPPHGQPGHVCSIPVGQPLDGSSLNMNNSSTPQKPTFQAGPRVNSTPAQPTAPKNQSTAPGMNPPHGQPGHVCGIPVGSPLPN